MERPSVYEDTYVVNRNLAYEVIEQLPTGEYRDGGVLGAGHRVWMQHDPQATTSCRSVSVYIEDLGVVQLNRNCLSRVD